MSTLDVYTECQIVAVCKYQGAILCLFRLPCHHSVHCSPGSKVTADDALTSATAARLGGKLDTTFIPVDE